MSEDCLYLNVWTPAGRGPASAQRPVMVWIHGGGFRGGSASTPLYWGDELARARGVIVVNLSYRVGALGFLAHPELTAESNNHASGNYGFLDIIAGLRWVQRNIRAFGGDPANVTIFGQSAGAWAINNLMISPLARGLFHAAIAQSEGGNMAPAGTAAGMALLPEAERAGVAFAKAVDATDIAQLRRIPADKIVTADSTWPPVGYDSNVALPIVDGYVIPEDPYTLYAAGKQADVPLLLGYNADEGAHMFEPVSAETYIANVRRQYGPLAEQLLALYPAHNEPESQRSQTQLWAQSSIAWHMWAWARLHATTSHSKVYLYYFLGSGHAGHGAELPYVFLYGFGGAGSGHEREMARTLSTYWTNFARTGNPNGASLPTWPPFGAEQETAMQFGDSFALREMPDRAARELLDSCMAGVRAAAPMPKTQIPP